MPEGVRGRVGIGADGPASSRSRAGVADREGGGNWKFIGDAPFRALEAGLEASSSPRDASACLSTDIDGIPDVASAGGVAIAEGSGEGMWTPEGGMLISGGILIPLFFVAEGGVDGDLASLNGLGLRRDAALALPWGL